VVTHPRTSYSGHRLTSVYHLEISIHRAIPWVNTSYLNYIKEKVKLFLKKNTLLSKYRSYVVLGFEYILLISRRDLLEKCFIKFDFKLFVCMFIDRVLVSLPKVSRFTFFLDPEFIIVWEKIVDRVSCARSCYQVNAFIIKFVVFINKKINMWNFIIYNIALFLENCSFGTNLYLSKIILNY